MEENESKLHVPARLALQLSAICFWKEGGDVHKVLPGVPGVSSGLLKPKMQGRSEVRQTEGADSELRERWTTQRKRQRDEVDWIDSDSDFTAVTCISIVERCEKGMERMCHHSAAERAPTAVKWMQRMPLLWRRTWRMRCSRRPDEPASTSTHAVSFHNT